MNKSNINNRIMQYKLLWKRATKVGSCSNWSNNRSGIHFLWCEVCGLCPLIIWPASQAGAIFTPLNKPSGEKIPSLAQRNSCVCSAGLSLLNGCSVRMEILFLVGKLLKAVLVWTSIAEWIICFKAQKKKHRVSSAILLSLCFLLCFLPSFLPFLSSSSGCDFVGPA